MKTSRIIAGILSSTLVLGTASRLLADGVANVLPSSATPMGYSLADLAEDTAVYNTGIFAGSPSTPAAPAIPFSVLEGDTSVAPNTYLYLPIFFSDDSGGALPATPSGPVFPSDVTNQPAAANYLDSYVSYNYGVSQFVVFVDGQVQDLDDSYIAGVVTSSLLDGTPAGTNYMSIAAVISPLSVGEHTVGFGGMIDGSPVQFGLDNIDVVPEPAALAWLGIPVAFSMCRRTRRA
jgi:hypothetical protein